MKRTRKLLCLVTLLLCFVVNGWAQTEEKSVTIKNGENWPTVDDKNSSKATFTCESFQVEFLCRSSITSSNGFKFKGDKSEYFTITPLQNSTVTKVVLSLQEKSPNPYFKVGNDTKDTQFETNDPKNTQFATYAKEFKEATTFAASSTNTSTATVESFTIYYKANGSSEQPGTTNITLGNIEDKSIHVGESYYVTNPTTTPTDVTGSFSYTTEDADIVDINGNTITGKNVGVAEIIATFTPTDGTKYKTPPTKTFTVTVTETGTSDTDVPAPSIKTLTYSTTKGIFDEEEKSNGDGIPYYGCIAVNAAYATNDGTFLDRSDKVSGLIYKFDTKTYTKEEFANHEVTGITTVSTRSALITIDGRTSEHLYLSVIAYHIKDGKRYYSDVVTRKYKYTDPGTRKELTLSCSESPFTLSLTAANKTSDEQGTLFNDIKYVTITATKADGSVVDDLSGLSFISRSSNRKLALSHMIKEKPTEGSTIETETTGPGNNILLMNEGRRAGVITVLVATPGNDDEYLPAFMKVNVVLKDNTIEPLKTAKPTDKNNPTYPDKVYTSIADLRTAGRQNNDNACVINFPETNPATVVAKFNYDDRNIGAKNSIFISDNSGYGLFIEYTGGDDKRAQRFIDTNKLVPGSSFTGSIYATYNDTKASNTPAFTDLMLIEDNPKRKVTIDGTDYTTTITVDHSGEGTESENGSIIGANIPVTAVADVHTVNKDREKKDSGEGGVAQVDRAERPYVNTVVTIPGIIQKNSKATSDADKYFLVQSGYSAEKDTDKPYAIFISNSQIPDIDLDNYVGLEGVFTGLLSKRTNVTAKLTIIRSAFFEAEELDEFILDETLPEGRVADRYNTGALSNKVNVKIHRKGWTTDTWGTICLPFDMTAAEFFSTFYSTTGERTLEIGKCTGTVENSALVFNTTTFNEKENDKNTAIAIEAGIPYFIKVSEKPVNCIGAKDTDADYYATISDRLINKPVPEKVDVTYVDNEGNAMNPIIGTKFEFRGLFGKKTVASETNAEGGHDALAGNQKYQYISTNKGQNLHYLPAGSVNGFAGLRAYLYFPEWNTELNDKTNPGTSTTNVLTISFVSEGATSISGIVEEGISDGKVFNLSGQYVGTSSACLNKGIYIRNGKKFVVK